MLDVQQWFAVQADPLEWRRRLAPKVQTVRGASKSLQPSCSIEQMFRGRALSSLITHLSVAR